MMTLTITRESLLAQQLKADVYDLCRPEGRMVGTAGHVVAQRFLERRLGEIGCEPYVGDSYRLPYAMEGLDFVNLIGVIPGQNRSLPPLLIGAHYDSVIAAPCADDNGAAVAICLAVATAIKAEGGLSRDLIIAIFDAEEPPFFQGQAMGSYRFYQDQLDNRGVHFALIYDLVGHDVSIPFSSVPLAGRLPILAKRDLGLPVMKSAVFMTGAESCLDLPRLVNDAIVPDGIKLVPTLNEYVGDMSDHGVFRKHGVPYLFLSCGRWAHYHMPSDTPDRLNYKKMARITKLTQRILEKVTCEPLSTNASEDHTLGYEIEAFEKFAGPLMPLLKKRACLQELKSREDMTAMVNVLLMTGL